MTGQVDNIPNFSADSSLVGYLYQCRYALYESLRRLRSGSTFFTSLETLDDVVFEKLGDPPALLQSKHHRRGTANLTDASPDLWKTIRVWSENWRAGSLPEGPVLLLVTTAVAGEGSAAWYLRPDTNRNVTRALEHLNATVNSSTNQDNAPAYRAFRCLTQEQRTALATAMHVLDGEPLVLELDAALRKEVYFAAPRRAIGSFLQRLEGWWLHRALEHLMAVDRRPIQSDELEAEIARLREQFKQESLPIDEDIMRASVDASGYQERRFVQQLQLINVGYPRIINAIRNYYRAFEHRSRWIREELLLVAELEGYEGRLIEEWDIQFQQMRDEIGHTAAEDEKQRAARERYKWVESGSHPRIRPEVVEQSIARGTYQILSDRMRVGWHPDFEGRLKEMLQHQEA